MSINEKLDNLFEEWIKDYPEHEKQKFCRDGLVYKRLEENSDYDIEKEWNSAPRKILFLLKDQNDQGQTDKENQVGSDLRHWLDGDSEICKNNCKIKGRFIKRIAQLLYLLSYWTPDNNINFGEHVDKKDKVVRDCFNSVPFALVESKKLIETSYISDEVLEKAIEQDKERLKEELEILKPNIIVCCGNPQYNYIKGFYFKDITPDISINHPYKNDISTKVNCMLDYYSEKGVTVIHSFHPSDRKANWITCEKVLSPFKELINNYGIELKSNR